MSTTALRIYYGGTFDPVHDGHLAIARAACEALNSEVTLMPAADPPHRAAPGADAQQRCAMLELAIADDPRLRIDRRELLRTGPSYTVDTLQDLRSEYGEDAPLALLIGADSLLALPDWRRWRDLFALTHLIVAERPGSLLGGDWPAPLAEMIEGRWTQRAAALVESPAGSLYRLHQPLRIESATRIRQEITDRMAHWRDWVPPPVADYIVQHGLYRKQTS
ncbi:MAG: nicotinate-nucleotide adenylyltransferase [Xanthomonadaceae bacterium]|jgi:nicotinate-nucleotide adenylyltransferase|nr:nicotinate-nucleotide adenylyltransferase [Xanthomonadaceae bacterium]